MKIQLLSDLHLERDPGFVAPALPEADLLVLAGDIGSYQAGSRLPGDDFGLGRFSPRQPGSPWRRVLYVPGNHEYDTLEFDATRARLRALCEALGIEWLDEQVIAVGDTRFIGTTLWSDFDALAQQERTETKRLQQREKAFRAADFYLRKNTTLKDGEPVLAESQRAMALDCQAWLREALASPWTGRTVVVTHYAPSLRSADPRYGATPGTAGFCNGLDELLPLADTWLHGHLHCLNDYVVEGARDGVATRTHVVSNPLGYAAKGEQAAFRPDLLIDA